MGTTLYGNYGLKAIKIPSGKTVFESPKKNKEQQLFISALQWNNRKAFPEMSIKEAELED